MARIRGLAVDFDDTLAYFEDGCTGLISVFTDQGVSEAVAREEFQKVNDVGFSFERYARRIEARIGRPFGRRFPVAIANAHRWLQASLRLFPDVMPCLEAFDAAGVPVVIVTAGHPPYQKSKVELVGLANRDVAYVPGKGMKGIALQRFVRKYGAPFLFVDNRVGELDAVRESVPATTVFTIHILRRGGAEECSCTHEHCTELETLRFWLEEEVEP